MTPARYLQELRVHAAAQRLLLTDDALETIAETCGFANRFYLTRVFTQTMHIAPAAYRRASLPSE